MRHKNLHTSQIGLSLIALLLLAGCGEQPQVVDVPTLAEFPTQVNTFTPSPTQEATHTPTASPSDAPTLTETIAPTDILSPTPSLTFTPSVTPSDTITPTPSETPTPVPPTTTEAPTLGAVGSLLELALQATVLPVTPFPQPVAPPMVTGVPPNCDQPPSGGFAIVYFAEPGLPGLLGCPISTDANVVTAVQTFERGIMVYLAGQPGSIYVLTNDGRFRRFSDTWVSGVDPESGGETPPVGLLEPVRGFGKVWRENADVRAALGWAVSEEAGNESRQLLFERGRLIFLPQRNQTAALIEDPGGASGAWRMLSGGA